MNRTEHLLTILAEECNEVAQRASKALRFGLTEIQPGQEKTNAERIQYELTDLAAVVEMLEQEGFLPWNLPNHKMLNAKQEKIEQYLSYSQKCGTLKETETER